jgi:hypothetical protein
MKRNIFLISLSFCFLLTSCIPGLAFFIKNSTNEIIELNYVICDDLLYHAIDFEKAILKTLDEEETFRIVFSNNDLFNRGVRGEDFYKTETFLSFFEDITIKYLESGVSLNKDDIKQFNIQHTQKISAHLFTLLIGDAGTTDTKLEEGDKYNEN